MQQYSYQYIEKLLAKFMNGDTTLEEEKTLGDYFYTMRDIPEEWQCYAEMFAYFRRGMTSARPVRRRRYLKIAAAAASILLLLGIGIATFNSKTPQTAPLANGGNMVLRQDSTCEKPLPSVGETVVAEAKTSRKPAVPRRLKSKEKSGKIEKDNAPSQEMASTDDGLEQVRKEMIYQYICEVMSGKSTHDAEHVCEGGHPYADRWLVVLEPVPADTVSNNNVKYIYL